MAMQMWRCLNVNRESRRARGHEGVEVLLRLDDHEMHVEGQRRDLAHGFDDLRPEREVRNERPIHDVDVQPVGAAGLAHRDVVGEPRKVRAQERWRDPNLRGLLGLRCHGLRPPPTVMFTRDPPAAWLPAGGAWAVTTAAASAIALGLP